MILDLNLGLDESIMSCSCGYRCYTKYDDNNQVIFRFIRYEPDGCCEYSYKAS